MSDFRLTDLPITVTLLV